MRISCLPPVYPDSSSAKWTELGRRGAVGFLLALVGSALTMAVSLITAHALPVTIPILGAAATLTQLVQPGGKLNSLLVPRGADGAHFFPGYILFGAASAGPGCSLRGAAG
jgi:hypothetical protein